MGVQAMALNRKIHCIIPRKAAILALALLLLAVPSPPATPQTVIKHVIPGAERPSMIKTVLKDRAVAVVANHTSLSGKTHLVDTLLGLGINVKRIFSPEHGYWGSDEAGKEIHNGMDKKTGLPIVSLFGKKYKPTAEDLADVDMVVYDIQDVGVRFYTYISTLTFVMEACAENMKQLLILDRPNPNGFYVDGPVLDMKYKSFVGMLPVPIVYGMTTGELAIMIDGEKWLPNNLHCDFKVIRCRNYTHRTLYTLPVHPSPNLRTMKAVYLYPSCGLLEGTVMNVGRGTDFPFQVFGHPQFKDSSFSYVPARPLDSLLHPLHLNKVCYGVDLRGLPEETIVASAGINLSYLRTALENFPDREKFFKKTFELLSGNGDLRKQILDGLSDAAIRKSWEPALSEFKTKRKKYLIYEDF